MTLAEFIKRYPPQPPRRPPANDGELRLLVAEDGVLILVDPPAQTGLRIAPGASPEQGRHLWAFRDTDVPYIVESAPAVRASLESGVAKHTNLTGGEPASCGGELWVDPVRGDLLYVNGASGRYGPRCSDQLEAAVSVLEGLGFEVVSFGWDEDVDLPARVLR